MTWSNSDNNKATLSATTGTSITVTGKAAGTTNITVSSIGAGTNYTYTSSTSKKCAVTVESSVNIKMNPLYYISATNMTGTTKKTLATTTDAGTYYALSEVPAQGSSPVSGYHMPDVQEWLSIIPAWQQKAFITDYISSSIPNATYTIGGNSSNSWVDNYNTSRYLKSFVKVKFGYNSTTKAGMWESSYFRYVSATETRAIRFLGTDYCSAWRYVWSGGNVTIYATLIGNVANTEAAAQTAYNNWSNYTFGNDATKGQVMREFIARGYQSDNTTNFSGKIVSYWHYTGTSLRNVNGINNNDSYNNIGVNASGNQKFEIRLFRDN